MYQAQNFDHLLGLNGLSEQLLKNHFTLYQGYVTNTNKLAETLEQMTQNEKTATPEYTEIKRRFGWEWNGMRLHELYFGNLAKKSALPAKKSSLNQKITAAFGSWEDWAKNFQTMAAMRGIGWVILYWNRQTDQLFNCWINEHDTGHLSGATPLLVLDVFEHAYLTDYGIKRADYLTAIWKVIDWSAVEKRLT